MLSFSTLSVFAALALSAFTSAAPTLDPTALVGDVTDVVPALPAVPVVSGLVPRDTKNVVTIINETTYKVTEYTVEFRKCTSQY